MKTWIREIKRLGACSEALVMKTWIREIKRLGACSEALVWLEDFDSLDDAWQICERGDWMLWLLGRQSGKPESCKKLVLTACQCARLALPYVKEGETRPLKAIEMAEAWAKGESGITLKMVRHATYAVAAYAAYAAYAAAADADAALAAAYAAYAASAASATREKVLKQCADIVRVNYPMVKVE